MNIYDIAREANVSIATVSRVLNGKPNISPKTAQRVREVLERSQYTPSSIARGLVSNSMRLVGVLMHDLRNTHYTSTAYVVEQELSRAGYRCLLCNTQAGAVSGTLRMLAETRVDGLIIIGSVFMDRSMAEALAAYFPTQPVVMVNGYLQRENVLGILCDEADGMRQCAEHLFAAGHRKIAYFHDNATDSARRKLAGYRSAMRELGLQERVLHGATGFEGGAALGRELASAGHPDFTALMFAEDTTALGCIRSMERAGLQVPEDLAVTGYTNTMFARMASRTLTTVDEQVQVLGAEAVRAFCDRMDGRLRAPCITIPVHLVPGETT